MASFKCTECGAVVNIPLKLKSVTCPDCGDGSFVNDGAVRRMYPGLHMYPVDHAHSHGADYPPSKWMLPWTRPVIPGNYDVRFRHTEPAVLRLRWNGACFVTAEGQRVQMTQFLTWRGALA
jgi:hypothetical protein